MLGFALILVPGLDDGGYFERTWGFGILALGTVVAIALLLQGRVAISRLEFAMLCAFAGLTVWIWLSGVWGIVGTSSVNEAERAVFYFVALAALLVVVESRSAAALLGGVVAGITALAAYGLLLLAASDEPDFYEGRLLADPVGYANAMGALAAIGILLTVGVAGRSRAGALAFPVVVLLVIALFLTESRGSWISLVVGLSVMLVVRPSHRRLLHGRWLWAVAAVLGAAVLLVAVARPQTLGDRPDFWRAALADANDHRRLGSGAGSDDDYWFAHGHPGVVVRDAHSLYLETLAELGIVGLVLVLAVLSIPLAAVRDARPRIRPAAAGGLVAYIVHAGIDWDWEMPVVTLAGIACAAALLVSARDRDERTVIAGSLAHRREAPGEEPFGLRLP